VIAQVTQLDYATAEHSMTEEHKREQKPWTPTIEGEPLLNAFANPLNDTAGVPHNPVLLDEVDAEGEESSGSDPAVSAETPAAVPVAQIKPAQ
jgi:hypothetical protein